MATMIMTIKEANATIILTVYAINTNDMLTVFYTVVLVLRRACMCSSYRWLGKRSSTNNRSPLAALPKYYQRHQNCAPVKKYMYKIAARSAMLMKWLTPTIQLCRVS